MIIDNKNFLNVSIDQLLVSTNKKDSFYNIKVVNMIDGLALNMNEYFIKSKQVYLYIHVIRLIFNIVFYSTYTKSSTSEY